MSCSDDDSLCKKKIICEGDDVDIISRLTDERAFVSLLCFAMSLLEVNHPAFLDEKQSCWMMVLEETPAGMHLFAICLLRPTALLHSALALDLTVM